MIWRGSRLLIFAVGFTIGCALHAAEVADDPLVGGEEDPAAELSVVPEEPWSDFPDPNAPLTLEDDLRDTIVPDEAVPARALPRPVETEPSIADDPVAWDGPAAPIPMPQAPRAPLPRGIPDLRSSAARFPELVTSPMVESVDSDLGVPMEDEGASFLPDFNNWSDPWFQMEGLRFRFWDMQIRMSLSTSARYSDNIFETHTDPTADVITTLSPTISIGLGNFIDREEEFFALRYQPQLEIFAVNSDQDTVNEFLNAEGQVVFNRLTTNFAFVYSKDSNPQEDTIGRQETQVLNFSLNNSYSLGAKTALQFGGSYQFYEASRGLDYNTVTINSAIAYEYSPKLNLNFGPFAGITYVEDGGEQPFQGLNLGIGYSTLKKLDFSANLGVEARQFSGADPSGESDFVTPIFGFGLSYAATQDASIGLDLSRSVQNSGFVRGQTQISNQASLNYRHLLFRRIVFTMRVRYDILQYQGQEQNDRNDQFFEFAPSLGYVFWQERCSLSVFYIRRDRISEIEALSFEANSFGTRFQVQF